LNLSINNINDLIDCIKLSHIVLIVTDCYEILENDKTNFQNLLIDLLDRTVYLQMLVISDNINEIRMPHRYSNFVKVEALPKYFAAKMLKAFDMRDEIFPK